MDMNEKIELDALLAGGDEPLVVEEAAPAPARARRDLTKMMRKIPVTLTLEVGCAHVTLQDLMAIETHSVIELDTLAGEPLTIKVNGTPIGRAEVVVAGDNYALKVVELDNLDLDSLTP